MITIKDRKMTIPESERTIGYAGDSRTTTLEFCVMDPLNADFNFKLDLQHMDGSTDIVDLDKEVQSNAIVLRWTIEKQQIPVEENLFVQIRAFMSDSEIWHSAMLLLLVGKSINADSHVASPLPSEFEQMEKRMTQMKEETAAIAVKTPYIGDSGNWYIVQPDGTFKDSAVQAQGPQGQKGDPGIVDYSRLYVKKESDNRFTNALIGSASGSAILLNDVQSGADFSSLLLNGVTVQTGTGEKSPDNPYILCGTTNPTIAVCKKNLLCVGKSTNACGGVHYDSFEDGSFHAYGTNQECSLFLNPVNNIPTLEGKIYTVSVKIVSGTVGQKQFVRLRDLSNTTIVTIPLMANTSVKFTSAGQTIAGMDFYSAGSGDAFDYIYKIQLEQADGATGYEPYSGTIYPTAFAGYSLPNGKHDTLDAVSGIKTQNIGKITLGIDTVDWRPNTDGALTTLWGAVISGVSANDYDATHSNCDKLPYITTNLLSTDTEGYMVTSARIFIRIFKSRIPGWSDSLTTSQKGILVQAYLASNPITVLYELAAPIVTQSIPQAIEAYAPITNILTDKNTLTVQYNRDSNAILKKLLTAIKDLGGNIDL